MKKTSWTDELSNATKGTIIVCGILLVVVSVAVMILMFFPIQKEDHPTVVVAPVRHTEFSETTHSTTTRAKMTTTDTHTLSTWNAGIHGFNPDVSEHLGTQDSRYTTMDPRLTRRETTTIKPGETLVETTLAEGDIPFVMPATTVRTETTTVTVMQTAAPIVETEEMTAPPLPVAEEP